MATFRVINRINAHLRDGARTEWFQSYRIKDQGTDNYCHSLNGLEMLIRVNLPGDKFVFYWLYHMSDAHLLIEFVHEQLHLEAHEIIVQPSIKLFYDIDMQLSDEEFHRMVEYYEETSGEYDLTVDDVSRHLAHLYFDATLASLEQHGNDMERLQLSSDMMYTTRNRMMESGKHKLSIHVITNIVCSIAQGRAVVEDVKSNILHYPQDHDLEYDPSSYELISGAIDVQPYHKLGSLSISGGCKVVDGVSHINSIQQSFQMQSEEPFITRIDRSARKCDYSQYAIASSRQGGFGDTVSPEFMQEVYNSVQNIPYFDHSDWDLETASHKGCVAIIRRLRPSYCTICERQHDVDNTLMIIFNEQLRTGSYKCIRSREVKAIVFYEDKTAVSDHDLEQFDKIHKSQGRSKAEYARGLRADQDEPKHTFNVISNHESIDSDELITMPKLQLDADELEVVDEPNTIEPKLIAYDAPDSHVEFSMDTLQVDDSEPVSNRIATVESAVVEAPDNDQEVSISDYEESDDELEPPTLPSKVLVLAPDSHHNIDTPSMVSDDLDDTQELSVVSTPNAIVDAPDDYEEVCAPDEYESDSERESTLMPTSPKHSTRERSDRYGGVTAGGVLRMRYDRFVL